jgi:hypothetical protein
MADERDPDAEYDFAPREEPEPAPASPAPMREAPAAVKPERIAPERVCPHCGFEIFGKLRGGRCPECAAPLDFSGSTLLQFADGEWIRRLSNGTLLFAFGLVCNIAGVTVGSCGFWNLGDFIHLFAGAAIAYGIWLATIPEVGVSAERSPTAAPARSAAITIFALWILVSLVALTHSVGAIRFFTILLLLTYAAEAALIGLHLQKLAARIPSDGLAAQSLNLAWLMPVLCLVLIAVNSFRPQGSLRDDPLLVLIFPLLGVPAIMMLWALSVVLRLGLELRNAAIAGEAIAVKKAHRLAQKKN